jgi:hypothetical protein
MRKKSNLQTPLTLNVVLSETVLPQGHRWLKMSMYICMNVWEVGHKIWLLHHDLQWSIVLPLLINPLLILHLEWSVGLHLGGCHSSYLVPWRTGPGDEILNNLWPNNCIGYVADSSSSRHLLQIGSSVNPSLKRCPFRWQCPVNSLTTHLKVSIYGMFCKRCEGGNDYDKCADQPSALLGFLVAYYSN